MEHANILQRDLQGAINELRSTRSRVVELTDENSRLHDETKQVWKIATVSSALLMS